MDYLKVRWIHGNPNDPVLLMSELGADRHEVRKVEVFADGRLPIKEVAGEGHRFKSLEDSKGI